MENWPRLNMSIHQKFRNTAFHWPFTNALEKWSLCHRILKNMDKPYDLPSKVGTVWSQHHGRFPINIQYPHFFSVVQSPFDNWHLLFSSTTFFEIGVCKLRWVIKFMSFNLNALHFTKKQCATCKAKTWGLHWSMNFLEKGDSAYCFRSWIASMKVLGITTELHHSLLSCRQ